MIIIKHLKIQKYALLALLLCTILFLSFFWYPVNYVPVLIIFTVEPYYEEFPEYSNDEVFLDAVEYILKECDEWYFRVNNKIYIKWRLARDTDLLANYTHKAFFHCEYDRPESRFGNIKSIDELPDSTNLKGIKR